MNRRLVALGIFAQVMNTSGGITGRFSIELNALENSAVWVGADDAPQNRLPNNTVILSKGYRVADALTSGNAASGNKDNVTLRATLVLEPAFTGAAPGGGWEANAPKPLAPKTFTLIGWKTDGTALPASQVRSVRNRFLLCFAPIKQGHRSAPFVRLPYEMRAVSHVHSLGHAGSSSSVIVSRRDMARVEMPLCITRP